MTDTQREAFEAAYAKQWSTVVGNEKTGADVAKLRTDDVGEPYGDRAYLNGCWWGYQAAQAADAGREAVKYQWRDINGNWIDMPDGRMYRRLKTQGATVRALFDHPPIAAINDELVEALEACLAKGSRWHSCDPIVQQARAALSRAKEQK